MYKKIGWTICILAGAVTMLLPSIAHKTVRPKATGEAVFTQYCSSCHTGGGNNVNPLKPLAESKQLVSIVTFKQYLKAPPGHMPYYQNVVNDQDTLEKLYKYCKALKKGSGKQV